MRILLIDQFGEPGGAQRGLVEAATGFAARGWELHAALPAGPVADALIPLCRSVALLRCGPFTPSRKGPMDALRFASQLAGQVRVIRRMVRTEDVDVLYVNGPRLAPAAMLAAEDRPIAYHAHSVVEQPLASAVTGVALRFSRATLLASSRFVAKWLEKIAPDASVRVIYNGIAGFGASPLKRARFTRVGVLGRIAPEKGQLAFARATQIAANSGDSLQFQIGGAPMFAGDSYYQAVRAVAGSTVAFHGWIDDVGGFLKEIDLLVVPSQAVDANPRVIPEAYAAGVPVLAFDGGGTPELVEHGVTGLLVNSHTPEALAAAIVAAVRDPDRLNAIAERAYARWRRQYTLARFQSEVCEAVEDAAVGRRRELDTRVRAKATA